MHIIGFSHHYRKMHGQTWGTLVSVRSTASHKPDRKGISYDTIYENPRYIKHLRGELHLKPRESLDQWCWYPLEEKDFEKPMLQLVFIGAEHQIPFTTYRKFPKDYKPFWPASFMRGALPYTDLIGDKFVFKFKGEELSEELEQKVGYIKWLEKEPSHVEIYE